LHSLFSGMSSVSHAAAMRMAGISRGHLLIPLFGAAAVPKTAHRSEGQLGFIVLMGPGFGLTPMPTLVGLYYATGGQQREEDTRSSQSSWQAPINTEKEEGPDAASGPKFGRRRSGASR
jgi:hypothetical protein